jgi:hypothetical protein
MCPIQAPGKQTDANQRATHYPCRATRTGQQSNKQSNKQTIKQEEQAEEAAREGGTRRRILCPRDDLVPETLGPRDLARALR